MRCSESASDLLALRGWFPGALALCCSSLPIAFSPRRPARCCFAPAPGPAAPNAACRVRVSLSSYLELRVGLDVRLPSPQALSQCPTLPSGQCTCPPRRCGPHSTSTSSHPVAGRKTRNQRESRRGNTLRRPLVTVPAPVRVPQSFPTRARGVPAAAAPHLAHLRGQILATVTAAPISTVVPQACFLPHISVSSGPILPAQAVGGILCHSMSAFGTEADICTGSTTAATTCPSPADTNRRPQIRRSSEPLSPTPFPPSSSLSRPPPLRCKSNGVGMLPQIPRSCCFNHHL